MNRIVSLLGLSLLLGACATPAPINTAPPATALPTPLPVLENSQPIAVAPPPPAALPQISSTPSVSAAPAVVRPPAANPRQLLGKLIPASARQRDSWRDDILGAFNALQLQLSAENLCAVIAVIEQESSFQSDPVVPGLPKIVWGKIGEKAGGYYIPLGLVKTALLKTSRDGRSYKQRIDSLRTEGEMNDLFEEMAAEAKNIGLPMGMKNPIRTGGPMQVSVEFAEAHVRIWPYPYPRRSVRSEVFSQRGGVYFGSAILLQYPVNYSNMLYRFADFNAGRYSSRNAAFQQALASLSGSKLAPDGDLLRYDNGAASSTSSSQKALAKLRGKLQMSDAEILRDLKLEKSAGFADTPLYRKVMQLADAQAGKRVAREVLPQIRLQSPKITRKLTTAWFAERVNGRYQQCLARAG